MVVVSAVAFGAGALCLYYGARDLRSRRAIRRLDAERDEGIDPATDRAGARGNAAAGGVDAPDDPRDDVAIERGFVLLALGALCVLFGALAL
jgi:hypothetical protein